jgi:type VI secretion system secreted protein VgrG
VEWKVTRTVTERPYIVQYQESDWHFVERLCADEGIYYWFDLAEDATKLVFSDDSTTAPDMAGGAEIPYRDSANLDAAGDSVSEVKAGAILASDATRIIDYNPEKPKLALDSKAKADKGLFEVYDYPGRFAVPGEGDARAKRMLEALRAERSLLHGLTASARMRAGQLFEVVDHPVATLNGKLFCLSMAYHAAVSFTEGERGDVAQGLTAEWTSIPQSVPFRMRSTAPVRMTGGPQTGVVCGPPGKELYLDDTGRERVQFYWDRVGQKDDKASTPMRVGQLPMGGSMVRPRVGWEVLVAHDEGNVDAPGILNHLYDGQYPVPYPLPANKTRTAWQTATTPGGGSSNEIRFEDKAGSEEMFLNASKDMNVVVGDNKDKKVGNNHAHEVGANHDIKVGSNDVVEVKVDQEVSVGAMESLTVTGSRTVGVTGSSSSTIGATRMLTATMGHSIDANGGRTMTVGGAMMSVACLGVSRAVLGSLSVTVGGAWLSAAVAGMGHVTGGASAETVGGAKICAAGKDTGISVRGAAAVTVGGAHITAAGGDLAESAGGSMRMTVGGAILANATSIDIEAESEIVVQVGGATLTIKSSSVELKAPALASPGAIVAKKGGKIHHNP